MNKNKNSAFCSHHLPQLLSARNPAASHCKTEATLCSPSVLPLSHHHNSVLRPLFPPFKPFLNSLFLNTSFLIIPAFKYTQNRLESKQGNFGLVVSFSYAVCSPSCCQTYLSECFPLPLLHSLLSLPQHTADATPSVTSHFWCHDFPAMWGETQTDPSLRCLCQILCK